MTLTQLRTFLAIAEAGSVHGAAEQLFVTQSAVSSAVIALQRSLGFSLVSREGRGLRLTEAGLVYADYIRRVLGLLDEANTAAAAEADPEHGSLRIAATTTAGEQILPHLLTSFRFRHPQVGIRLEVGNRERVRALLHRHEVDLLLSGRPGEHREQRVLGVRPHELIVVTPDVPPESERGAADLAGWLADQAWMLREPGSGTRKATEALLAELAPRHSPRTLTVGSNAAIRESVIAGLGVTLISRDAVTRELEEGRLVEVPAPGTPLPRDWYLIANPGRLSVTASTFVAHALATRELTPPPERMSGDASAAGVGP